MYAAAGGADGGGGKRVGVEAVPETSCSDCVMMSVKPASASHSRAL
jgi:hypothetical protein